MRVYIYTRTHERYLLRVEYDASAYNTRYIGTGYEGGVCVFTLRTRFHVVHAANAISRGNVPLFSRIPEPVTYYYSVIHESCDRTCVYRDLY